MGSATIERARQRYNFIALTEKFDKSKLVTSSLLSKPCCLACDTCRAPLCAGCRAALLWPRAELEDEDEVEVDELLLELSVLG